MKRLLDWAMAALLSLGVGLAPASAEDIDIYVGSAGADSSLPNVIFVLDNTSNWSRQAQKWPDGNTQGQSEVKAIKAALQKMTDKMNVGLVEFTTQGNANEDGGYVRFNLQKLNIDSQAQFGNVLDKIYNNINDPTEKRNSNTSYGNLMYDVYNYLSGGGQSQDGNGTPSGLVDSGAYSTLYSKFKSPLSSNSLCSNTYLIFIGNPDSNGPEDDSVANSSALKALYSELGGSPDGLYGDSGKVPLPIPGFSVVSSTEGVQTLLGLSSQCYSTNGQNSEVELCSSNEGTTGLCVNRENCACVDNKDSSKCSGGNTVKLQVFQNPTTVTQVTANGSTDTTSGRAWNFDDWAKFMHDYGVPVSYKDSSGAAQQQRVSVVTYTIDVFNKQQNAEQTGLMLGAASVSGGRYFAARSETAIVSAITSALSDILSVSATFAAVTLPLSATNRAQQENQVFIGMFRPDKKALPRWFGNLKRYQVGLFNGQSELADVNHDMAINPTSGFATECAKSFWTEDSQDYWSGLGIDPSPRSQCADPSNSYSMWSDLPDGPFVEKGGVAQLMRNSVLANRKVLTVGSTGLSPLTAISGDSGNVLLDYLYGKKVGADEKAPAAGGRPSIHGDVIHSRPLTINYGGDTGTYVYYGVNDGLFRAIAAESGEEQWSLLALEHVTKIKRLYDNQPLVAFPNQNLTATPTPTAKDYFFDGSTGQIIRYNSSNEVSQAYIYPSMRRGGRVIYALDVTTPTDPKLLWRFGCPNLSNDDGCPTGYSSIGQTWSTPLGGDVVVAVTGTVVKPVVMFGGGYDTCLDSDTANFPYSACNTSGKGRGIYILDAKEGTVLRTLPTDAPVVAELASVDMDFDGKIDFAYAADAAGSLYRVNFATLNTGTSPTPLDQDKWTITKVANTLDKTRRFLNQPTVAVLNDKVYVALGSGNRERPLESNYPYVSKVQDRFYVYVDLPGETLGSPLDLDGGQLADVTVSGTTTGSCITTGTRGWFISLKGRGEQVVNPAAIAGGDILFNSYRPGGDSPGLCSRALGVATAYQVSLFNPSSCDINRSTEIVGGGIPIPPIVATVSATDGATGGEEKVVTVCIGCEGLKVKEIAANPKQTRRRIYWNSDIDR